MYDVSEHFYQVYDAPLLIVSESPPFSHHVQAFLEPLEIPPTLPVARITLFQTGRNGDPRGIQICCPEQRWTDSADTTTQAWFPFRRLLLRFILDCERRDMLLHGSTVCNELGHSAIIIGSSGAGKTTATIGLMRAGFSLVADEYTSMTLAERKIRSFPSGMTVSDQTVRFFPEISPLLHNDCSFRDANGPQWTVNPSCLYPMCSRDALAEPKFVFVLFPAFQSSTRIELCSPGEALWYLRGSLYPKRPQPPWARTNPHEYQRSLFCLADHLVHSTQVYRVFNGRIADTVAAMASILRGERMPLDKARTAECVP